ncbi:MAG: hypothetical protein HZA54_13570 [Planctomycetes bacterium]|nr:hypothetical protein [Planctomycetota bacterium]
MLTHAEFRSDLFPCNGDPEEGEVNPHCWGERLAKYLVAGPRREGIRASDPAAEDWGWRFSIPNEQFSLWVGCTNYEEYPDGYLCFIQPETPWVRRWFRRVSTVEAVESVQAALQRILSREPGVRDLRWWTADEFNRGGRPSNRLGNGSP